MRDMQSQVCPAATSSQLTVAHTPPAFTPSSYGNVLQKRARMHEAREARSRSSSIEADFRRERGRCQQGVDLTEPLDTDCTSHGLRASSLPVPVPSSHEASPSRAASLSTSGGFRCGSLLAAAESRDRLRAASIDLLAELDLDGALADWGNMRKPPPSAEVMSSAQDDQLMGFDMEMPFCWSSGEQQPALGSSFGRVYEQLPIREQRTRPHSMKQPIAARSGRCNSISSYDDSSDSSRQQQWRSTENSSPTDHDCCGAPMPATALPISDYAGKSVPPGGRAPPGAARRDGSVGASASSAATDRGASITLRGTDSWGERARDDYPPFVDRDETSTSTEGGKQPRGASSLHDASVSYDGKVSSTISVPPDTSELVAGPAPPYETLINFQRAKSRAQIHCVMCGRQPKPEDVVEGNEESADHQHTDDPDGRSRLVVIPRQNKDVCRECDKALWRHLLTNIHFKWCKGCKRFRNLTAFAEKLCASKCDRCRERGRQGYMRRKGGTGSPPTTPRHDDDA